MRCWQLLQHGQLLYNLIAVIVNVGLSHESATMAYYWTSFGKRELVDLL